MHSLAVDQQRARGHSYQQVYVHVYSHPDNQALREKVKSEHLSAMLRGGFSGDTAYDAHNNPVGNGADYHNPHPGGSGPRPRA